MGPDDKYNCSLCGKASVGFGNNPEPLRPFDERCCDSCNMTKVIPARLGFMREKLGEGKSHRGK